MGAGILFGPGRIGPVTTANRIVRAGTSETAAGDSGEITDQFVEVYETLARNRVGLILSATCSATLAAVIRRARPASMTMLWCPG